MNMWLSFLIDSMAFGATFIYGSTGEILTEKAGHLNLGIPGIMCMGGAGECLFLNMVGKSGLPPVLIVLWGILGALLLSVLCGLIYSFLTVSLRANQNVTGLALTTFGAGLMKVIVFKLNPTVYLSEPKKMYRWPFETRTDSLQRLGILFFLAVVIALAASWVLYRTRAGLHLRAVGENPATADAVGINVTACKYLAICIGSGISGLGGFYYIIDYMAQQHNIHVGRTTAEEIKFAVGSVLPELPADEVPEPISVTGRNILTGLPLEASIDYKEIAMCIDKTVVKIENEILKVLQRTPPELYSNIVKNGVWLAGGGSLLRGIAKRFGDKVNIPFHVAEDPLKAVARGTCLALSGIDRYPFLMK